MTVKTYNLSTVPLKQAPGTYDPHEALHDSDGRDVHNDAIPTRSRETNAAEPSHQHQAEYVTSAEIVNQVCTCIQIASHKSWIKSMLKSQN